jgi:hypothetical protein
MGLAWAVDEASSVRAIEGAASMMTVRVLRSEAGLVGRDVGDGVGCHCAGVDLDGVHRRAVDVGS